MLATSAPERSVVMKVRRFVSFAVAAALAIYFALLRRPILTWGATEAETTSRLPSYFPRKKSGGCESGFGV